MISTCRSELQLNFFFSPDNLFCSFVLTADYFLLSSGQFVPLNKYLSYFLFTWTLLQTVEACSNNAPLYCCFVSPFVIMYVIHSYGCNTATTLPNKASCLLRELHQNMLVTFKHPKHIISLVEC